MTSRQVDGGSPHALDGTGKVVAQSAEHVSVSPLNLCITYSGGVVYGDGGFIDSSVAVMYPVEDVMDDGDSITPYVRRGPSEPTREEIDRHEKSYQVS